MSGIINKSRNVVYKKFTEEERRNILIARKKRKEEKRRLRQAKIDKAKSLEFEFDTIHGFRLKKVEYTVLAKEERKKLRKEFDDCREDFLKHIGKNNAEMLKDMGMKEEQINLVKEGKSVNGYNVHHKLPIHGGGKNEFSNFIIVPDSIHKHLHRLVIDPQIPGIEREGQKREIKIPWMDSFVYIGTDKIKNYDKDFDKSKDYESKDGKKYALDGKTNPIKCEEDDKKVQVFKQALTAIKMNKR